MSQTKAQLLTGKSDQTVTVSTLTSGDITSSGNLTVNAQGDLRLADSDSSNYIAFQAPATVASNVTYTWPAADGAGANYVLATDGSGTLSWIADPAGQWVTSGSNIYFTGGNVGIGDCSPSNPLSVTGV